ncbi:2037_t:CDS:2 [Paraglomus occultum]|uniref:2037_t:CDS:1 n=1 Tax=Paraglomus occultum TaxID=144539 RepID=A0A9N9AFR9_9GLOM|nr:2037_t:CDS:2 [Paraglomus occultum]
MDMDGARSLIRTFVGSLVMASINGLERHYQAVTLHILEHSNGAHDELLQNHQVSKAKNVDLQIIHHVSQIWIILYSSDRTRDSCKQISEHDTGIHKRLVLVILLKVTNTLQLDESKTTIDLTIHSHKGRDDCGCEYIPQATPHAVMVEQHDTDETFDMKFLLR